MPILHSNLVDELATNLESRLDAMLESNFAEGDDDKKKSGAGKLAVGAGAAAGAAGAGAYLRGKKVSGPVRPGARGVLDTMRKGPAGLKGDLLDKKSALKGGLKKGLRKVAKSLSSREPSTDFSALDRLNELTERMDDLLEMGVHDVVGARSKQDKKQGAPTSTITKVGYGAIGATAGGAAGAGALYAAGRAASGGNARGKDALRAGARSVSSKARGSSKVVWGHAKAGASKAKSRVMGAVAALRSLKGKKAVLPV